MINNNKEDRKEMAKEISEVRVIGNVNMYNIFGVIDELYILGYDFTAKYIADNQEDYTDLLVLSGQYNQSKEELKRYQNIH